MRVTGFFRRDRLLFTALMLLLALVLTSCGSTVPQRQDGEGILMKDATSDATVGLLNPDAEVRGVWIATVGNINYPSKKGLDAKKLAEELDAIVEKCVSLGINSIFFQVRPSSDALYRSELFPISEYLSGTQGKEADGSFDPLAYLIDASRGHKIGVHAWVNPLRVTYGSAKHPRTDISELAVSNPARKNPDWVIPYADGKLYFDAGNPDVREYVAAGVAEIVRSYAVDGVVFDDYFYPYPVTGAEFDDSVSYEKYGGGMALDTWRRENINALVRDCFHAVKEQRKECLFGISPFGIWQNDDGENGGSATRGFEAYKSLYCDALAWAEGGYVDYIAPQLYWRFDTAVAPFGELLRFWNSALDGSGVKLLTAHGAYMYGEWENPEGEISAQIAAARETLSYRGSIMYGYASLEDNTCGICDELSDAFRCDIIYSDTWSTGEGISFEGIADGAEMTAGQLIIKGGSDPATPLFLDGRKVSRDKNGAFSVAVKLGIGENTFVFSCGDEIKTLKIICRERNFVDISCT